MLTGHWLWIGWKLSVFEHVGGYKVISINGRPVPPIVFEVEPATWMQMRRVVNEDRYEPLSWRERLRSAWQILRRGQH